MHVPGKFFKSLLFLTALFAVTLGIAQNNQLFDKGKEHYKNGEYQEAITSWMQILENEKHSAAVYFNLGNAHYKLNHVGPSVYYYEKALQLAPNNQDIKTNLSFAHNARIDSIEALPKTFFSKWYHSVASLFTYDGWAMLAVISVALFVLLFLLYYFSYAEKRKRLLFAASLLFVLIFIGTLTMAYQTYSDFSTNNPAIVFTPEVTVKSGPSLGSENSFVLHEGTKVQIIARDSNWARVLLANGKEGWIPLTDLKAL